MEDVLEHGRRVIRDLQLCTHRHRRLTELVQSTPPLDPSDLEEFVRRDVESIKTRLMDYRLEVGLSEWYLFLHQAGSVCHVKGLVGTNHFDALKAAGRRVDVVAHEYAETLDSAEPILPPGC